MKSMYFAALLAAPFTSALQAAEAPAPAQDIVTSPCQGGTKHAFSCAGHAAYVVVPPIAAPGKPWIWRTAWPTYHDEVDRELVRCGYHIGYIEVVDLLGSNKALDAMDAFYTDARVRYGLAEKCAIEPNSRGGLHAYRYASRRPERIACLLGDVPVMDFRSWPSPKDAAQWKNVMDSYGFKTQEEALAYGGNPVEEVTLAPIAKAKIPLRHTICLNDAVVPPKDNTFKAQAVLKKLGWDIELVVVPSSNDCEGHHFPFPKTFESAQFVMRHTYSLPAAARGVPYFRLRDGLANSKAQFERKKTGRIAFVGGSITYNRGWRDELIRYFQERFPETKFEFISTGIPSVGSTGHAFRLDADVFSKGTVDLVFVEAAVNDYHSDELKGYDRPALALRGMEGVVRRIREQNPATDIVEMHFIHPTDPPVWKQGKIPFTVAAHEKVAEAYGCPSLNLSREVVERIASGEFTWEKDFRDVHPSPYGQRVYANSMMHMLDAAFMEKRKPKAHPLPKKPLDPASFFHGRHGKLEDAKLSGGFRLEPKWSAKNGQEQRAGFFNCPAITSDTAGAEFSYDFEGKSFGLFLAAGRDTGVIEWRVDGGPWKTQDTFTPWSGSLNLPWVMMLEQGLPPGKHTVKARTTDKEKERCGLHVIHVLLD